MQEALRLWSLTPTVPNHYLMRGFTAAAVAMSPTGTVVQQLLVSE